MLRSGRGGDEARPLVFLPDFTCYADGSVLVSSGKTKVLCTVCLEDSLPPWMKNDKTQRSWLTAEYAMLPGSTHTRTRRERPQPSGRTQEIQRLIGRTLRAGVDFKLFSERTFVIDCDVLQADGGTRTAAITGASVALHIAAHRAVAAGRLAINPVLEHVAAVSVGLRKGEVLVDLDYAEDSTVDVDMNVVMTESGRLVEVQGTGERATFSRDETNKMLEAAERALVKTFAQQRAIIEQYTQRTT